MREIKRFKNVWHQSRRSGNVLDMIGEGKEDSKMTLRSGALE